MLIFILILLKSLAFSRTGNTMKGERMQKRTLEELNLLDDFMMGAMVSHPVIGPKFSREILSVILNRKIGKIEVIPQKVFFGANTDKHGIRLDVYIEEDAETGTIYDIEPDQNDRKDLKENLPKRVRFYHAKIDSHSLKAGMDYSKLKKVIVIMITPYDPFGRNRMVYTLRKLCVEEPDMPYDDGAMTIYLYTNGKRGDPPEELQKLLHYMEKSKEENADTALLKEIHQMTQEVKHDEEVSLEYMKIFEREKMIREDGIAECQSKLIQIIRKKANKKMSVSEISELLECEELYVHKIVQLIQQNPEDSDIEIAEKYFNGI